jgi:hypothetical protein
MSQPVPRPEPAATPSYVQGTDAPAGAASSPAPVGLGPVGDLIGGDWPQQAADTIERVITGVRRKTTGPAIVASRALVYGIVAATFGLAALVLLVVAAIRAVDALLPTWGVHLAFGGLFSLAGLVLLRFAHRPAADDDDR